MVLHYVGQDPGTSDVQPVVDAPRQLKVVRGELLLKKGNAHDSARLPPGARASSDQATSTDEFLVTGRVPVIGKIVASENARRQRTEQMATGMRGSALEVEINVAAAQPS